NPAPVAAPECCPLAEPLARVEPGRQRGVVRGGLGGDPPVASIGADADQGDRAGDGMFQEHGEAGAGRQWPAAVPAGWAWIGGRRGGATNPGVLRAWPSMPATVIAERVGWSYSIRLLRDRVAELRPVYLPPDPPRPTAYAACAVA